LAVAEPFIVRLLRRHSQLQLPLGSPSVDKQLRWVTALSVCATLITPYHWKIYRVIGEYAHQKSALNLIDEMRSLSFRDFPHYLVVMLVVGAAITMGRYPKLGFRPFTFLLFVSSALLSFRTARDMWLVVVVALCIIATATRRDTRLPVFTPARAILVACIVALLIWATMRQRKMGNAELERLVEATFPTKAVQFIQKQGYSGPLFNHFDWGGYLIWALPQIPVSIDGRANLYGDWQLARNIATWSGIVKWNTDDVQLNRARLIIANKNEPLTSLLRFDPRFRLVYEDSISAVYIANQGG